MSNIYLTRIHLTQYRSFADLDVVLPDGPGVLVVHGSNGIGKSSLFDSLEWALTDQIDHFREATGVKKVGSYLCRWREGSPGPTSVTMEFSGNKTISRTLSSAEAKGSLLGGNVGDITEFLQAEDWRQKITAPSRYLLLTHFLGQSILSRFANRDPGERFDILKEAAQSDEIEALGNTLHGRGNTTAARAYTKRITALEEEAKQLASLLDSEANLWNGMEVSGALDDASAEQLTWRISAILSKQASGEPVAGHAAPAIKELEAGVEALRVSVRRSETLLGQARRVFDDWERNSTSVAGLEAAAREVAAQLAELDAQRVEAVAALQQRQGVVEQVEAAFVSARDKRDRLIGVRDALVSVASAEVGKSDADAALMAAHQAADSDLALVARLDRRLQLVRRMELEVGRLDERLTLAQAEMANLDQWIERERRIAELRNSIGKIEAGSPDLEGAIAAARTADEAAQKHAAERTQILEALRGTVSTISGAVASIAAHLPEEACDCPVCATHFVQQGELQRRASSAAERLAPLLLEQEERVRAANTERDRLRAALSGLQSEWVTLQAFRREAGTEIETNRQLRDGLFGSDDASDSSAQLRRGVLLASLGRLSRLRQRKWYWRNRLSATNFAPGGEHSIATRRRDVSLQALNVARQAAILADQRRDAAAGEIATRDRALGDGSELRGERLSEALQFTEANLAQLEQAVRDALTNRREVEERLSSINLSRASADARQQETQTQLQTGIEMRTKAELEWQGLGHAVSLEPDNLTIAVQATTLELEQGTLREVQDLLKQLRDGRTAWALKENHRLALEKLRDAVDGAPNSEREQLRREAEDLRSEKAGKAEATREAKDIARLASIDIADEVAQFNSGYIKPLATLMRSINQAILCDPRVGMDLNVNNRRIEQSAAKDGVVPAGIGEIDPILVHSEGQMAALSVSLLCAASLTYPWSRWRGLVLDDPLQHNDAIHSAAFADFICNLVATQGYQILISTHDRAQAEFLQRKVSARRLPCSVLSLLGEGQEGIQTSFRPASVEFPAVASA